jgi:ABC-type antimicrobial peptide transport system permease subunit
MTCTRLADEGVLIVRSPSARAFARSLISTPRNPSRRQTAARTRAVSDAFGQMTFSVPFGTLALLLVGTVVATLLATVSPAISASRIRPAVALRLTD